MANDHLDIIQDVYSQCMAMNGHKSGGCGFPLHLGSRIRAKLNSQELKVHLLVHGGILCTKYMQWL